MNDTARSAIPEWESADSVATATPDQSAAVLGSIAARILALKRKSRPTRPLIIEFCGSPKSGKSSAITSLGTFLKRNHFKVRVLKEYAAECPIEDKTNWLFNVWTACSMIRRLAQYMTQRTSDVDVILLDRGLFDALCWLKWLRTSRRIDDATRRAVADFLMVDRFRAAMDLIFIFTTSPEESIKREHSNLLTTHYGTIMNPGVLEEYRLAVLAADKEFGNRFKRIEHIDTSSPSQNEVGRDVTVRVLNALAQSVMEEIASVPVKRLAPAFSGSVSSLGALQAAGVSLSFAARKIVENAPQLIQPISVAVVTNHKRDRVAVFRKAKKALSQGSAEEGHDLLYLGGHVRQDDGFGKTADDLMGIFETTLERELSEELGMSLSHSTDDVFCIWDRSGVPRSRIHFAVVFTCDVDFEVFEPKLDRWEYDVDGASESLLILPIEEVDRASLEPWSQVIFDRVFDQGKQESLPFVQADMDSSR